LASKVLHEMGYLHVHSIAGGFDAWAEAGNPVAKPEAIKFE
jgi:rhodanese-related sulfurtransferase